MMKATPAASFIVPEPDFLLELLIIALDAPAQLGGIDQIAECDAARQSREPVLGRLLLALWPRSAAILLSVCRSVHGSMQREHATAQTARTAIHCCPPAIGLCAKRSSAVRGRGP